MTHSRIQPRSRAAVARGKVDRRALLGGVACAIALSFARSAAAAADPAALVREVGERAIAVLGRNDLDKDAKVEALEQILEEATDLDLIARLVMGRYWRQATPEQRMRYLGLFRALVRRAMAERLDRYSGETIEIVEVRPIDDRDTMVRTLVKRPNGAEPYAVDWRIRQLDGRFVIIDVVAEGVSLLITQRSEVAEIIGQKGIDGLLATMEERLRAQQERSASG